MCVLESEPEPLIHQVLLDDKRPFIGLEHLSEVHDNGTESLTYKCDLCNKEADQNNIIVHLNSHSHRENFLVRCMNDETLI